MGTPDEKVWPGVSKLPNFSMIGFREYIGEDLRQSFSSMDENGFNLMMRMLTLDPKQRITAQEALEHEYFNKWVHTRLAILRGLKHPNIIELLDVLYASSKVTLVFEYIPRDLNKVIEDLPPG